MADSEAAGGADPPAYTLKNLAEVEDMAPKFGYGEIGEARFANADLDTEGTGISFHRLRPSKRQGFGHRHEGAEEVYVVIAGSGRVKLDDETVELRPLDAVRIAPRTARALEAGPEGMEVIAFGPRRQGDAEMLPEFWPE